MNQTILNKLSELESAFNANPRLRSKLFRTWNRELQKIVKTEANESVSDRFRIKRTGKAVPFYVKGSKDSQSLYLSGRAPNITYDKLFAPPKPWPKRSLSAVTAQGGDNEEKAEYLFSTKTTRNKTVKYQKPMVFGQGNNRKVSFWFAPESVSDIVVDHPDFESWVMDAFDNALNKLELI